MSVEKMIKVAQEQCGKTCYVWGAKGQDLNSIADVESWVESMEKNTPEKPLNVAKIIARYQKLSVQGINPIRAFDCSGLVYYCLHSAGYDYKRTSAKYYFSMCKEIGKADLRKGDLVFHETNGTITHVGIYVGNGDVIHSKGRQFGVVQEQMSAYKTWNKFGYLPDVRDGEPIPEPTPTESYILFNGSFNIRQEPSENGRKIGIVRKGQSLEWLGDVANGWHQVLFCDAVGYVTGKKKYQQYMEFHSNEEAF